MLFETGHRLVGGTQLNNEIFNSVATGLTASGTTIADALQLTADISVIGTASASTGVILPKVNYMTLGQIIYVFNGGASAVKVYSGDSTIDGTAGATGVTLTNAKRAAFFLNAANAWTSAQMGVVSA